MNATDDSLIETSGSVDQLLADRKTQGRGFNEIWPSEEDESAFVPLLVYCLILTACMAALVSASPAMAIVPLLIALILSSRIKPESRGQTSRARSLRRRRMRALRLRRFGAALFVIGLSSGLAVLVPSEMLTDAMRDVLTAISFTAFVFSVVFLFGTSRSQAYGVDVFGVVPPSPTPNSIGDEQPGTLPIDVPFEAVPFDGGFGVGGDCG